MDGLSSWRRLLLPTAAGIGLTAGGARYYLTHPQRVFPKIPPDLAGRAVEVTRSSDDAARLHGWWLPSAPVQGQVHRTIVHHHGFGSCGGVVLARKPEPLGGWSLIRKALDRGFNVLLIDARAHGGSGGSWDPKGIRVKNDLTGWIRWLRGQQRQDFIGLWGHSFGAIVGLMALVSQAPGQSNEANAYIDAMVLDSPAVSSRGVYSGVIHGPVYWVMQPVIRHLANGELYGQLQRSHASVPVLSIHGMDDHHVPPWHSEEVYRLLWRANVPERTDLWLVPGADHLQALEIAPEDYSRRCLQWFDRWLPQARCSDGGSS